VEYFEVIEELINHDLPLRDFVPRITSKLLDIYLQKIAGATESENKEIGMFFNYLFSLSY